MSLRIIFNIIHPCPFTLVFLHKKRRFQDVSPYVFFNQIELTNQKRSSRLTCSGRHRKWPYFGGFPLKKEFYFIVFCQISGKIDQFLAVFQNMPKIGGKPPFLAVF